MDKLKEITNINLIRFNTYMTLILKLDETVNNKYKHLFLTLF